jgi:hypothetical protein
LQKHGRTFPEDAIDFTSHGQEAGLIVSIQAIGATNRQATASPGIADQYRRSRPACQQ